VGGGRLGSSHGDLGNADKEDYEGGGPKPAPPHGVEGAKSSAFVVRKRLPGYRNFAYYRNYRCEIKDLIEKVNKTLTI
jgi:hypothetical protein